MAERISRSEQKRRFKRLEEAASELARLGDRDLAALEVEERVKGEVLACRPVKGGALKRQIKYLAKVVREEEAVEQVLTFLEERKGSKVKADRLHHEAERLRDLLINEVLAVQQLLQQERLELPMEWPAEELEAVAARCGIAPLELRRSLHQYARTRMQSHSREVYRMIKAALERLEREAKLESHSS